MPSSRWATRLTRSSAPRARRSTRASRRSAASAPSTASTSTSIIAKQAAEWTEKALGELAPAEAAGTATVVHVDFKGGAHAPDDDEPQFTAENPLTGEIVDAGQPQRHRLDARDLARRDRRRGARLLLYCRVMPSASLPENDPGLALELCRGRRARRGRRRRAEAARALRRDDTVACRWSNAYAKLTQRTDVDARSPSRRRSPSSPRTASSSICSSAIPRSSRADQLFGLLRPLPGRLYSVASSPKAHPGEAHLLVGAVRWESHGKQARRRCLDLLRRPPQGRRHGAHLRQAEPPLPPARRTATARSS